MIRPTAALAALASLLTLGAGALASAQGGTPAAFPATPAPAECRVKPRSLDDLRRIAAAATPAVPAGTPADGTAVFVPPAGDPADTATVAQVTATVTEYFACVNAGNALATTALQTDEILGQAFATAAGEASAGQMESVLGFYGATPVALPPRLRVAVLAVGDVRRLANGQVGAVVTIELPTRTAWTDYFVLEEQGGRYLIAGGVIGIRGEGFLGTGTPSA